MDDDDSFSFGDGVQAKNSNVAHDLVSKTRATNCLPLGQNGEAYDDNGNTDDDNSGDDKNDDDDGDDEDNDGSGPPSQANSVSERRQSMAKH